MEISYDPFALSDLEVARLYEASNHGEYSVDGFLQSKFAPGAFGVACLGDGGSLLGIARVFSDDSSTSWIAELVVPPSDYSSDIKTSILKGVVERFGHTAIFSEAFSDEVECYKACGITPKSRLIAVSRAPTLDRETSAEPYRH